ncbi:MAG: glycosyltransferase family 39 protein [Anaerolineae bacterium]
MTHRTPAPWLFRIPALLFLLLSLALRAWALDRWSLWYDEAYCWWVASQVPLEEMFRLSAREVIPPLYYLFLRLWIPLAGATAFALRWPSVLLGVLTVACAARLAWRLTGSGGGAIAAALLFAVGTPFLWASREVRMYGPLLAWTMLANGALLEFVAAPFRQRRRVWLWAGATLAALYSHTMAAFWLIGQALIVLLFLLRRKYGLRALRPLLPPALAVSVLYLPWAVVSAKMAPQAQTYWHGFVPPLYLLRLSAGGLTVMEHLPPEIAEGAAGLILLSAMVTLALGRPSLLAGIYPLLYLLPLGIAAYLFSQAPKWGARHATPFAPAVYLAFAVGWGALGRRRPLGLRIAAAIPMAIATVLSGGFLLQADRNLLTNPQFAREDWRAAAHYIQEHRAPGEIVIIETGSVFPAWLYYAGDEGLLPMPNDPLLDVTHVLTYPQVAQELNVALADTPGVWLVTWLDHVTDPTQLVAILLEDAGREEPVPRFRGLGVRHFLLDRPPQFPPEPPATDRPDVEILPGIRLWGYSLPQEPHPADRPLPLRVWWVTDDPKSVAGLTYAASFRLRDALDAEWGQDDRILTDGNYRPERWPPGTPVLGRFFLSLPAGIPPGVYTPTLTLFTTETARSIALHPITVTRPASPPEMPKAFTPARSEGPTGPLMLLGVHLFEGQVGIYRRILGELFWEVREPLRGEYRVVVSAGGYREENPLAPTDALAMATLHPGDRIRSRFRLTFPCRVLDLEAPLEIRLVRADGTETGGVWYGPPVTVRTGRVFAEPAVLYEPLEAEFGPGFATLLGYRLDPSPVRAGEPFTVTLIWRAGCTDDTPRSVFVHITPPEAPAPLVAPHDGWPAQNARPTHIWVLGEIVTDPHPLPGLPAGRYQVRLGLYAPDGERIPVTVGSVGLPDRALSFPLEVRK